MADRTPDTESPTALWNAFRARHPECGSAEPYDIFRVGNDPATADLGAELILSGAKTATSALPQEFSESGPPFEGALSVLLDGKGEARAIVETTRVDTVPFNRVGAGFARAYGEWDGTLETWRQHNGAYYRRVCSKLGLEWSEDRPLVCEYFKVVFTGQGTRSA